MVALSVAEKWLINSIDIKSAFLQGKPMERKIYLKPPIEAYAEGKLWCLKKAVYGLSDASRIWYLSITDELMKLNVSTSSYDKALFFQKVYGKLSGLLLIHVDDFLWSGDKNFQDVVISRLKEVFKISRECEGIFKYIGINIVQSAENITIDQLSYIDSIQFINLENERIKDKHVRTNTLEKRQLRGLL